MINQIRGLFGRINARYRYYLPIVAVCALGGGLWQLYVARQEPVRYTSEGKIVISGRMNLPEANTFSEEVSNFLGTQVEILRGESLAQRVRQQMLADHPGLPGSAAVQVAVLRGTSILVVTAEGLSPDYTPRYLNTLLDQYIESRSDRRRETNLSAMSKIRDELPRVEAQLAQQEEELFRFKERNNLGYMGRQSADAAQLLSQLKLREANLRMQLTLAEDMMARSVTQDRERRLSGLESMGSAPEAERAVSETRANADVNQLRQQLIKLRVDREQLLLIYKPAHPRVVRVDQEIQKQSRLLELISMESEAAFNQTVAGMRSELTSVTASIVDWERKALESTRTEAEFEKLQSALTRTRELYSRLIEGLQSIDVGKEMNMDVVQILQQATPAQRHEPSITGAVRRGFMIGALIGAAAMVGLARVDPRAFAIEEIVAAVKVPSTVEIPTDRSIRNDRVLPDGSNLNREIREALRKITAALGLAAKPRLSSTVIFCASTTPGEGKSTVSLNLAVQAARSGLTTLLIDADLRRGSLGEKLGLAAEHPGLAELVDDSENGRTDCLHAFPETRLSIIPRGNPGVHTIDRLAHWLDAETLTRLKQNYQVIVIDSAPLIPVADSMRFLALVDHILMITRIRATNLSLANRVADQIRRLQPAGFHLVINGTTQGQGYYGGYGSYGYY